MPKILTPIALVLLLLVAPARADWTQTEEHWYVLDIDGAAAGWLREATYDGTADDAGHYRSETESELRISRGAIEIEIRMSAEWIETHAGAPVRLHTVSSQGAQPVSKTYRFDGDTVHMTSSQGGRTTTREQDAPAAGWLPPMAAQRFTEERMAAGAKSFVVSSITGEQDLVPTETTWEYVGTDEHEHAGRTIPVSVWTVTANTLPIPSAACSISSDGVMVLQAVTFPGIGNLSTRLTTREAAMAVGAAPPPELLVSSFVDATPPIRRARASKQSTMILRSKSGELPELPNAGAQRVSARPDGTLLITQTIDDNVDATSAEKVDADYLGSSSMCDVNDPMITKLAEKAVAKAGEDAASRAEALRSFVHGYISSKNLDTAFATASEVARMKRGDCSEHGVLLCALLRANGIPARVATGLVYADQFAGEADIFGWHMWTQALIDGDWVDYDATLPVRFDAAHILTGVSALAESDGMSDFTNVILLMGNLEVEIVDVKYD